MNIFEQLSNLVEYEPIITTAGGIIIALVTASSGVTIALIARNSSRTKRILKQTENEHGDTATPNLRDNIDTNQKQIVSLLLGVIQTQNEHDNKLDSLFLITTGQQGQIDDLTHPKIPT